MKATIIGLLVVMLAGSMAVSFKQLDKAENFRLELETLRATTATGPCGTQFVVGGLGVNKDQAAVAGQVVPMEEVSLYFQKETGVGILEVYKKNPTNNENVLVFRRQK